jgi:hypothetical protein
LKGQWTFIIKKIGFTARHHQKKSVSYLGNLWYVAVAEVSLFSAEPLIFRLVTKKRSKGKKVLIKKKMTHKTKVMIRSKKIRMIPNRANKNLRINMPKPRKTMKKKETWY